MGFKSSLESFQKVREAVAQEKKKPVQENNYNDSIFFKPALVKNEEKTKFKIRFLPPPESSTGKPWVQINYHMFERQGDKKYIKVIDPKTFNKDAENPIAQRSSELFKSTNALDLAMAKLYYRKPRYFCLVYVKDAPENQKHFIGKVLIYEAGVKVFNKMKSAMEDQELCFWDAYKGRDFALIMRENPANEKWPNYDDSTFLGTDCPIEADEKKMEEISAQVDKISIKEKILAKDPIKSGAELLELMDGGRNGVAKPSAKPAQELVSNKPVNTTKGDVDFGDIDVAHTPAAKKADVKTESKVEAKAEKPAEKKSSETDVPADEFDVNFSDEDFK